jgi:hypothetical protein
LSAVLGEERTAEHWVNPRSFAAFCVINGHRRAPPNLIQNGKLAEMNLRMSLLSLSTPSILIR